MDDRFGDNPATAIILEETEAKVRDVFRLNGCYRLIAAGEVSEVTGVWVPIAAIAANEYCRSRQASKMRKRPFEGQYS